MSALLAHDGHRWGDGGFFLLGWLVPLILLAALAGLVFWAVTRAASGDRRRPVAPTPAGIDPAVSELRARYASGELTREDFLRMSADLGGTPSSPDSPP